MVLGIDPFEKEKNPMSKPDNYYRRIRGGIAAPDWVKTYLLVHPSAARRMLREDFIAGVLDREEERAIRRYIDLLVEAESEGSPYPRWRDFIEEEVANASLTEDELDELWAEGISKAFPRTAQGGN